MDWISWAALIYLFIALAWFVALAKTLEPLDLRAWLTILWMAVFWPITFAMMLTS